MEWLIGKRRSRGDGRSGRSTRRSLRRALNICVLAVVALATVAFVSAATGSPIPAARADDPKINIIVPHPADKHTQGPVGTNITVRAGGLKAGDTYILGYANADAGCGAGFQAFQNATETMTETVGTDGTFSATIAWPASANFIGVTYYICAQNQPQAGATLAPTVQSDETFRVDAASAPAIDVAPAASATPAAGTASPLPLPDGSFYQHSTMMISGQNFAPGGSTLLIVVSARQLQQPADFKAAAQNALRNSDGERKIISQSSGDIAATVTLPASLTHGSYYVYVFSADGTDQAIPSLVASKQITIVTVPTPQPTATIAPTTTPANGSSSGGGPGIHHMKGVIALAALSILLFIAGVIALLSAAAMPGHSRS